MRVLLAILLAAASPAMHDTAAGNSEAKAVLLAKADLGKGWSGKASPQEGVTLGCNGYHPSGRGVVEVGRATGPAFSYGTAGTGPFILQKASVYQTAGQAGLYWKRAVTPKLVACIVQTLQAVETRGVKVKILQQGGLKFQSSLAHHAAYRVVGNLTANGHTLKNYLDVLVVGEGRTISVVTISSFVSPPPTSFETIIGHELERKLGGPSA